MITYTAIENTCDSSVLQCHQINNESVIKFYRKELQRIWNYDEKMFGTDYFPGSTPVSLERKQIKKLAEQDYLVSLKADGVRHVLMLTRSSENEPTAVLINRRFDMFEISIWADLEFFENGTLFDGEFVRCKDSSYMYIVFDIIRMNGDYVGDQPYSKRLSIVERVCEIPQAVHSTREIEDLIIDEKKVVAGENTFQFQLATKPFVVLKQALALWAEKNTFKFKSDGVIMAPAQSTYKMMTSKDIYKWKPLHTIDVMVASDPQGKLELSLGVSPHILKASSGTLFFEGKDWQCKLVKNVVLDAEENREWTSVCECTCDILNDTTTLLFTPLMIRTDKNHANGLTTVKKTLVNIIERIQIEELLPRDTA